MGGKNVIGQLGSQDDCLSENNELDESDSESESDRVAMRQARKSKLDKHRPYLYEACLYKRTCLLPLST